MLNLIKPPAVRDGLEIPEVIDVPLDPRVIDFDITHAEVMREFAACMPWTRLDWDTRMTRLEYFLGQIR